MIVSALQLLFVMSSFLHNAPETGQPVEAILDFGKGELANWRGLNDDVMGGRSRCTVKYSKSSLTWEGRVSLENNGGFSSVRSPWAERDLSAYDAVTLRCRTTTGVSATALPQRKIRRKREKKKKKKKKIQKKAHPSMCRCCPVRRCTRPLRDGTSAPLRRRPLPTLRQYPSGEKRIIRTTKEKTSAQTRG